MSEDSYGRKPILMDLLGRKKKDKEYLELVVFLDNKPKVLRDISDVLVGLDVEILEGFHDVQDDHGVWATFLEIDKSMDFEGKIKKAREIPGVKDINYHKMGESDYFEKFFFPLGTEDIRFLVMSQSAFLRITKSIINVLGSGGEALLYEEGIELGSDICETMRDVCEGMSPEEKLELISNLLKATGWCITDFNGLNVEGEGYIEIHENVETKEGYPNRCHFTRGVLTQLLREATGDDELELRETWCIAAGKPCCRFNII